MRTITLCTRGEINLKNKIKIKRKFFRKIKSEINAPKKKKSFEAIQRYPLFIFFRILPSCIKKIYILILIRLYPRIFFYFLTYFKPKLIINT